MPVRATGEQQGMERRLAAVMMADVAGYGRLSQADEEGTRARFQADLREVFESQLAAHRGRLVKTMGDGLLMEFASVVDALRCAIDIQRAKAQRDASAPDDRRLVYRIGINLGDVIVEGDDIHGDGVNIADRLQALAEPGGVMISGTTYDHLKGKLDVGYAVLGEQRVKNIADPVRVYRVLMDPRDAGKRIGERAIGANLRLRPTAAAAIILLVVAVGGLAWWLLRGPTGDPPPALPDKPSIAVLPFVNMSDDPKQESFADGVTDELITELSKVSGLFIISRNSTFVYKGKNVPPKQVSRELGVRYVLEGSVQRSGEQLRINAQLVDALSGGHVWADKFDGSLADVFALQDKVTRSIADALAIKLTATEEEALNRIETKVPAAYDAFLRGWVLLRRRNPDDLARAVPHFEEAIKLDPEYGRAYAALAMAYFKAYEWGWNQSLGLSWREARRKALGYLADAQKRPTALSHQAAGWMLWVDRQFDQAIAQFKEAIELDPGDSFSYAYMGGALYSSHRAAEAVAQIRFAMRLDPHYPSEYVHFLGLAQFALEQYGQAAASFETAIKLNPEDEWPYAALAATYGHLGRKDDAVAILARFNRLRVQRGDGPLTIDDAPWLGFVGPDFDRLVRGFRLAGAPDNVSSGEFAGFPRVTADEVRALFLGHRLHGRVSPTGGERAASITADGVPTWSGDWGSFTGDRIRFEDMQTCFGASCGTVLRNAGGTKGLENEYIWVDRRGAFAFSQVE
jgi:adenylate cyclase